VTLEFSKVAGANASTIEKTYQIVLFLPVNTDDATECDVIQLQIDVTEPQHKPSAAQKSGHFLPVMNLLSTLKFVCGTPELATFIDSNLS
jgi:hypothetical protein